MTAMRHIPHPAAIVFFTILSTCFAAAPISPKATSFRLPLNFTPNVGQAPADAEFEARTDRYGLLLSSRGATLIMSNSRLRLRYAGAARSPRLAGVDPLRGTFNLLDTGDPARSRTHIPTYARVRAHEIYKGIDVVYYGADGQLELDFIVEPGADPSKIRLAIGGTDLIRLEASGDLAIETASGPVRQHKPRVYQQSGRERTAVDGEYVLLGRNVVGLRLGKYDPMRPLTIDPVFTYLGGVAGSAGAGSAIATDGSGNAYIGVIDGRPSTADGSRVVKLNSAGEILYTTIIPGAYWTVRGIAVDSSGSAYVVGSSSWRPSGFGGYAGCKQEPAPGGLERNAIVA